jgi:ribose transport system permease protein
MSTMEATPPKQRAWARRDRRSILESLPRYGTLIFLALAIAVFSILKSEAFFTTETLVNVLEQSAVLIVVAVGLTAAMVMYEFDLSIAAMASLCGVLVTGFQSFDGAAWPLAAVETLAIAAAIGLVSGLIVAVINVNSFIVTLAMGTIVGGINQWYNNGQTISLGVNPGFVSLGRGKVAGVPDLVLIAAGVSFLVWLLLTQTATGRNMYAIGGNREAARLAGIPIARVRVLAFVISAALAGLGGMMLAARSGAGFTSAGGSLLLQAFTACFLGSVTLRDGEFHVAGTVLGVLLLTTIFVGLTIVGVADYVQSWVTGALLIFAVASSGIARRFLHGRD